MAKSMNYVDPIAQGGILRYFKGTPRQSQTDVLLEIEDKWDETDVFVVVAPTAFGKSLLANTILSFAEKEKKQRAIWQVPDNMLVDQIKRDFPTLHVMEKMSSYRCLCNPGFNCEEVSRRKREGEKVGHCPSCLYKKARIKSTWVKSQACNYHIALAHGLSKTMDVLVMDEAHLLVDLVRERAAVNMWQFDYKWPDSISTYGDLLDWLETFPEEHPDKKLKSIRSLVRNGSESILVEKTKDWHGVRRQELPVLKLKPLDVSDKCGILWGDETKKKIILMSATFTKIDLKELGLDKKRVCFITPKSPIPIERRPWTSQRVTPIGSSIPFVQWAPKVVAAIHEHLQQRKGKGIIHVPYAFGNWIANKSSIADNPRVLFHDRENKREVFKKWTESSEGVLVASGMYTGIDLKGDLASWQLIVKVPYPSLADPALRHLVNMDPRRYAWWAARVLIQAYGRVCRTPEDFGETFILDSNVDRLIQQNRDLFPDWFLEAQEKQKGIAL